MRIGGMRGFTIVWIGQLVSMLGSGMTMFGISIWAYDLTGEATALALAAFFGFGPAVLLSPVAGALVDRLDRKLVMMLSDVAAGLSTIVLFALLATNNLQLWHIFAANAFAGAFQAFQFPAYSAAITMMVDKSQYARANGMLALAQSGAGIFAPLAASTVIGLLAVTGNKVVPGVRAIFLIDIVTFVFAVGVLFFVHIPNPERTEAGRAGQGNLWRESAYGFEYILARPSLLGLQMVFFFINLVAMFAFVLTAPMVLARTGNDAQALGIAQMLGGVGGVLGGLLLSTWGGPKRRIHGVLLGMILTSVTGALTMGWGRSVVFWAAGLFFVSFWIPLLNGSNQAIWQAKVAPDVQGRVFAVRRLIAQISAPLAMLSAGPLADWVFEPAMMEGGALANTFDWLVGIGPGAGMGLMFVISGVLGAIIGLSGYLFPFIRNVEDLLPDHDAGAPAGDPVAETEPEAQPA